MVKVKITKFGFLRAITSLGVILVFVFAPFIGIFYGTTSALTFGDLTLISPLEWALLNLGAKTFLINLLIPFLLVTAVIVIFGRFFCGWICPIGVLLDYSHNITARKRLGTLWHNREKYIILLAVLAASLLFNFTAPYLFSPPGVVYRTVILYALHGIIGADLAILLLIFILDVLATRYHRTWCNTLCPLGTLISALSLINLVKPKVDEEKCNGCLECERTCPMRIPLIKADKWLMMACNKCLKCLESCPIKAVKLVTY